MSLTRRFSLSLAVTLLLASATAGAQWDLNGDQSSLYYVTSKAGAISELNVFTGLSGEISEAGEASLVIDLASVDTNIDVRDERMRELFFEVDQFPEAHVDLRVDIDALRAMQAGESKTDTYDASVTIRGATETVETHLTVTRLRDGEILIHNERPIILDAMAFGLGRGLEQLREVAGLPSINSNVVVGFNLRYRAGE